MNVNTILWPEAALFVILALRILILRILIPARTARKA